MLGWIIVGIVGGFLTGRVMPGTGYGPLVDLVLGVVGAVIGGRVFHLLELHSYEFIGSLITATLGAVDLVVLGHFLAR